MTRLRRDFKPSVKPGARIAVGAGSRGITNLAAVVREVIDILKDAGAKPFIVPAMGSHGGATAEGQLGVLHSYGITEEFVGCPIRSSMEVVHLGTTPEGWPVYLDKNAGRHPENLDDRYVSG